MKLFTIILFSLFVFSTNILSAQNLYFGLSNFEVLKRSGCEVCSSSKSLIGVQAGLITALNEQLAIGSGIGFNQYSLDGVYVRASSVNANIGYYPKGVFHKYFVSGEVSYFRLARMIHNEKYVEGRFVAGAQLGYVIDLNEKWKLVPYFGYKYMANGKHDNNELSSSMLVAGLNAMLYLTSSAVE